MGFPYSFQAICPRQNETSKLFVRSHFLELKNKIEQLSSCFPTVCMHHCKLKNSTGWSNLSHFPVNLFQIQFIFVLLADCKSPSKSRELIWTIDFPQQFHSFRLIVSSIDLHFQMILLFLSQINQRTAVPLFHSISLTISWLEVASLTKVHSCFCLEFAEFGCK